MHFLIVLVNFLDSLNHRQVLQTYTFPYPMIFKAGYPLFRPSRYYARLWIYHDNKCRAQCSLQIVVKLTVNSNLIRSLITIRCLINFKLRRCHIKRHEVGDDLLFTCIHIYHESFVGLSVDAWQLVE